MLLVALAVASSNAFAQGGPPPGGGEEDGGGAYASPSGIPDAMQNERLGIPFGNGRGPQDRIELPMPADGLSSYAVPNLPAIPGDILPQLDEAAHGGALTFNARMGEDGATIPDGLVWRLFSTRLNREGKLQLIGIQRGGSVQFNVPTGSYLLHVGYGRAGVTKRIDFDGKRLTDTVVLEAGGLRLSATTGNGEPITSKLLTFDIYTQGPTAQDRRLVAEDVVPGTVVRLNAGDYHVVSNYGAVNAVARADIKVETARVTDARLTQRAAEVTLKLVREAGGEALADTAWSISSSQGDLIRENVGAFSSMVLAEGEYLIVAKNKDRIYQRVYNVAAGQNEEVELVANGSATPQAPADGSGDEISAGPVPSFEELEGEAAAEAAGDASGDADLGSGD
jgi:hypothetical protein